MPCSRPAVRPERGRARPEVAPGLPRRSRGWAVVLAAAVLLTGCSGHPAAKRSASAAPTTTASGMSVVTSPSPTAAESGWQGSLHVAMPTDRVTRTVSAACRAVTSSRGWLARENAKPGRPGFDIPSTNDWTPLRLSLSSPSVGCGGSVRAALSGASGTARLEAYRVGWYKGAGGRLVWQQAGVPVRSRATPGLSSRDAPLEVNWAPTATIPITPAWTPGLYMIEAFPSSGGAPTVAPLVVRDDGGNAPLLIDESVLTWAAYNSFGGASLYQATNPTASKKDNVAHRARTVGLSRPLVDSGYRQMHSQDMTLAWFAERLGVDIDYTTDVDLDQEPSQLVRHAGVAFGGHSEYWTRRMYDGVEAARNAGVNLAFLGGNNVFWQSRLSAGPGGADSRLTVYKSAKEDPFARTQPELLTVHWNEPPMRRDAAELLGLSHSVINVQSSTYLRWTPGWLFNGTGQKPGGIVSNLLGGESDTVVPDNSIPPNLAVIGQSLVRGPSWASAALTYYSAPSGAGVFAAGNMYWTCHLRGVCQNFSTPPATQSFVLQLTTNLLRTFATPRAGGQHPSTSQPPLSVSQLRSTVPAAAIGTYASSTD